MNKSFIIAVALILALFKESHAKAITDSSQQNIILNKHNEMRRMAAKGELSSYGFNGAAKMYPLTWDSELANKAEELASTCSFAGTEAGQNVGMGGGGYATIGPGVPKQSPSGSGTCINCFADENEAIEFLQYGWIKVSSGPNTFNQFTQMVDDDTFKIGCALNSNCPRKYYLVCNYDNNRASAYETGTTASQCPDGSNDGLCSGTPQQSGSSSSGSSGSGSSGGSTGSTSGKFDTSQAPSLQLICTNRGGHVYYSQFGNQCTATYACYNGHSEQAQFSC